MLLQLAVILLACGAHHAVPEQEAAATTECEVAELETQVVKKKLPISEEEETLSTEDLSSEERHIVTFAETESSED